MVTYRVCKNVYGTINYFFACRKEMCVRDLATLDRITRCFTPYSATSDSIYHVRRIIMRNI